MALNDTPNIVTKPIVSSTGQFTIANQVIHDDNETTETKVGNLEIKVPNEFLVEVVETDRDVYTRVEGGTAVVRFWLRDNEVTSLNINNSGEGLLIAESNGEFADDADQFRLGSNDFGARLYMSLDDIYIAATDLSTLQVRILDGDGNEVENLNVATDFTNEGKFGTGGTNTFFQLSSGASAGSRLNYVADELIQL